MDDAVPAESQRAEPVEVLAAEVEDAGPLRPQQPLVAVGRQEIDRRFRHVQGKHAQGLNGVDEQQGPPAVDHLGQLVQVLPPAVGVGHPTDADDAGAAVAGGGQALQQAAAVVVSHAANLDAAGGQVQPGILVRGELVVGKTTLSPGSQGSPRPPG